MGISTLAQNRAYYKVGFYHSLVVVIFAALPCFEDEATQMEGCIDLRGSFYRMSVLPSHPVQCSHRARDVNDFYSPSFILYTEDASDET